MAPGTYQVDNLSPQSGTPIFRLLEVRSHRSRVIVPQAKADPQQGWKAEGNAKLVFACVSGSCALAQLWSGAESYAYQFASPKLGKGEDAYLRVIPMQRDKAE